MTRVNVIFQPTAVPVRQSPCLSTNTTATVCGYNLTQIRAYRSPREFVAPSPFKNPGPNRLGYQQKIYDGGIHCILYCLRYTCIDFLSFLTRDITLMTTVIFMKPLLKRGLL